MSVGVIGVGRIGAPLVARLVSGGHEVVATDIRPDRAEIAERAGVRWAPDAAQVAAAGSVVFTALPGSSELSELVLGPDRLLEHMGAGAVWIDMTSAFVELGRQCSDAARIRGVDFLDAPIGGWTTCDAGDYLRDFGLERGVEELDSIERTADREGAPHLLDDRGRRTLSVRAAPLRTCRRRVDGPGWLEE